MEQQILFTDYPTEGGYVSSVSSKEISVTPDGFIALDKTVTITQDVPMCRFINIANEQPCMNHGRYKVTINEQDYPACLIHRDTFERYSRDPKIQVTVR